jgi:chromosomal replication initiation ATPase DnaA
MNERASYPRADAPKPGTVRYAAVRGVLDVLEMVATRGGVSLAELLSRQRTAPITRARADAVRTLVELGHAQIEVGRMLGIDHTTVNYHIRGRKR